jgi:hypothetical protein
MCLGKDEDDGRYTKSKIVENMHRWIFGVQLPVFARYTSVRVYIAC